MNFVSQYTINCPDSENMCFEETEERGDMLLFGRGGRGRLGNELWRETSRLRESNVPAPGHLGCLHLPCQRQANENSCPGVRQ